MINITQLFYLTTFSITICLSNSAVACADHNHSGEAGHNSELTSWMTDNEPTSNNNANIPMSGIPSSKIISHTITGRLSNRQSETNAASKATSK